MSDSLRSLFDKARFKSEERGFVFGLVGKHNIDTTVSYAVPGRVDFLYVTVASKTVVIARNDAGVPQVEDYPVKMRRDSLGIYVILGRATNSTLGAPAATPASGVIAHSTSHQHGGTDEVATATPAANAIIKADADGKIGAGWLDAADVAAQIHAATNKATIVDADELAIADSAATYGLKHVLFSVIKTTVKTYYDSVVATLTNKTLDSTNISTLTSKTTPIDADSVVLVDSAATDFFKRVTGTNLKAYLKTYLDTLYVDLTNAQTVAGVKRFSSSLRTGSSGTIYLEQAQAGVTITNSTWTSVLTGLTGVSLVYFQLNSNATNYGGVFYIINNAGTITITPIAVTNMVAGAPAGFQVGYQASGTALQMQAGPSWPATIGCNVASSRLVW